jgi:hypothetical protein
MNISDEIKQLVARVRDLAARYPDAVYKGERGLFGCSYVAGRVDNGPDSCGCLLGQAAQPGTRLHTAMQERSARGIGSMCAGLGAVAVMTLDVEWLHTVQNFQDAGKTWGNAVVIADKIKPLGGAPRAS